MTKLSQFAAALALLFGAHAAEAQTYKYVGMPLSPNGGHNEFLVHLTGATAGTYEFGSGMTSFQMTHIDAANNVVVVIDSDTPNTVYNSTKNPYLTLDALGIPTTWFLGLKLSVPNVVQHAGYSCGDGACGNTGYTLDFFYEQDLPYVGPQSVTYNDFGTSGFGSTSPWSVVTTTTPPSSVPEPASLALLGFGMVGLLVSRRRSN